MQRCRCSTKDHRGAIKASGGASDLNRGALVHFEASRAAEVQPKPVEMQRCKSHYMVV